MKIGRQIRLLCLWAKHLSEKVSILAYMLRIRAGEAG